MNDFASGLIAVAISGLCFGSQFIPLKGLDLGDGLFIQWLKVAGALFAGGIVLCIRGFPPFDPMAALGGLLWSTANACLVPILGVAGVIGIVIMGNVQLLFGWATARFGWFGLIAAEPSTARNIVEYTGIVLTIASSVVFAFVRRTPKREENETVKRGLAVTASFEQDMLALSTGYIDGFIAPPPWQRPSTIQSPVRNARWYLKTAIALFLACCAAFASAQGLTPVTYELQHSNVTNLNGLDFAFSFTSGSFFGGTLYFLIYCILMRNRPKLIPSVALPGIVYGFIWSGGQFGLFYSNGKLTQAISYPICVRLPSLVMLAWDVIWYREIRGRRNLVVLSIGCVVSIVGVVLIGLADVV